MAKIKLDGGAEVELPAGFNTLDEFLAKYNEVAEQLRQLPNLQARLKQFDDVIGDPTTYDARLTKYINEQKAAAVQAALEQGATKKEAQQTGRDVGAELWNRWDTMTGQEQAQAMLGILEQQSNRIAAQLQDRLDKTVTGYWETAQKQLSGATGNTQQQFDLLARALDAKLANPKLDLTKVWGTMSDLAKATPDQLMALAMRSATSEDDINARIASERAKWEEESKKKQEAETLKVLNSDSVPQWLKPQDRREERLSLNKPGGHEDMKRNILERALQNGTISPSQI